MLWKGKRCSSVEQLHELKEYICDRLSVRYTEIERSPMGNRCFLLNTGEVLTITCMIANNQFFYIVPEYAENLDAIKINFTEDGDLLHPDDYDTAEEMIHDIISEAEGT